MNYLTIFGIIVAALSITIFIVWCIHMKEFGLIVKHFTRNFRMKHIMPLINSLEYDEEIIEFLKELDHPSLFTGDIIYIAKNKNTSKKVLNVIHNQLHNGYRQYIIQNENCPKDLICYSPYLFGLINNASTSKTRRMAYEEIILNYVKANIYTLNLNDFLKEAGDNKCPFYLKQKIIGIYKQYKDLT
jgi:hypothetical protein